MAQILEFPLKRATGRKSLIAGYLDAARYCEGKARLMQAYGDDFSANNFAAQAAQHMACLPPPAPCVPLASYRRTL